MNAERAYLLELLAGLSEDERRFTESAALSSEVWESDLPDPWVRFGRCFGALRREAGAAYDRLEGAFAGWLKGRYDPGEHDRLHRELAELGDYGLPAPGIDPAVEGAFVRDAVDHPDDPAPLLVLADWLEDHNDPRARHLRLLARLRVLRSQFWSRASPAGPGFLRRHPPGCPDTSATAPAG